MYNALNKLPLTSNDQSIIQVSFFLDSWCQNLAENILQTSNKFGKRAKDISLKCSVH